MESNLATRTGRGCLLTASVAGLLGVILGAFGAHGLQAILVERGSVEVWRTAVDYQFYHALGLGLVALWVLQGVGNLRLWRATALCWLLGILLFSGSLYGLALGGPRWLGPVTPLGGLFFIAGWACLWANAWKMGWKIPS